MIPGIRPYPTYYPVLVQISLSIDMKYYKRAEKKRDLLQGILCKCPVSNTVKMNVINLYRKLSSWNG